jgi:beta-galactosidase/beta-glucuronidase
LDPAQAAGAAADWLTHLRMRLRFHKAAAVLVLAGVAVAAALLVTAHHPPVAADAGERAEGSASTPAPAEPSTLTTWIAREDPADRGHSRGWQRGGYAGGAVRIPDTRKARSYQGAAGEANFRGSVAWYRTAFQAATRDTYAIGFASASFWAEVWVDGQALGAHRGGYLPFQMRARLAPGRHVLVVRVDWRDPERQAHEGFHRTWFNWGGLNGAVQVAPVGLSELTSPSIETTLRPAQPGSAGVEAAVRIGVEVRNDGPARTLRPHGSLVREGSALALAFPPLKLAHGASAIATSTVVVHEPALWSPRTPNLYALNLAVGGESSYAGSVGLREVSWRGALLYLNGHRLLLHGATIQQDAEGHGDALSPGDEQRIVSELRAIGANAVRAQHPLPQGLLERLDAAGMLVWQGVGPVEGAGNWYPSNPPLLAEAERQARTAILADQLHPSIIAWNLVDEVARNGHDGAEVQYVDRLARWVHQNDPGRMVAVDVWGDHPPTQAGPLYAEADAVAETDYTGWYHEPGAPAAQLEAQMRARLSAMAGTFAGKVLLISEFGAEANALNSSAAPGGYAYQARLLAEHIGVYRSDPRLTGMMIWLLRDYPLNPYFRGGSIHAVLPGLRLLDAINGKGLFSYSGQAKPAARTVARLFGSLPSGF